MLVKRIDDYIIGRTSNSSKVIVAFDIANSTFVSLKYNSLYSAYIYAPLVSGQSINFSNPYVTFGQSNNITATYYF